MIYVKTSERVFFLKDGAGLSDTSSNVYF
jgi:hypothetical protein